MNQHKKARKRRRRRQEKKRQGYPIKLGGTTYFMTPPKRPDMEEFESWIREHRRSPLDIAKANLDGLTESQQAVLLREALARESAIPNAISEAEYAAAGDTREGAAMLFWLMIRNRHPEVKLDDIEGIVESATDEEFRKLLDEREKMSETLGE